jgi:hypothetical protein
LVGTIWHALMFTGAVKQRGRNMSRKTILALIAVAGLAPGSATGALAFGGGDDGGGGRGGFHDRGHGYVYPYGHDGGYGYPYPYASSSYYIEDGVNGCYLRVMTPYGWRIRRGRTCN